MYKTLSGKEVAGKITEELEKKIKEKGLAPVLGIVVIGEDKPSQVYVRKKCEKAAEIGVKAEVYKFPGSISENKLLEEVKKLNNDRKIDGFIVQTPIPKHIDTNMVIETIDPKKDVDGYTSINMGKVMQNIVDGETFWPATPLGVMKMLEFYKIELEGKKAVVIGRGNTVGKPLAMMLLHKNATVTLCHSKTRNLAEHTTNADVILAAAGSPKLITGKMVKEGATVIDIGTTRVMVDGKEKVVGDVVFDEVIKKANCSPVPGGVGPLTVAMLLANTMKAADRNKKR
ncbi:MAG: bifunctional 5,10-methylenetetrahydrofolate dehydrogenase/5,10-methenyltetrahydrofolate cyclohydrolase [Candidatus Micrarchaeota archaeon]